jgi:site-specific recombinase XerD
MIVSCGAPAWASRRRSRSPSTRSTTGTDRLAVRAGVRRRFAPHQLRHAHALELAREGVPLNTIQRQLGHATFGTTSHLTHGIDREEIIAAVHVRRAPMMFASAGLRL